MKFVTTYTVIDPMDLFERQNFDKTARAFDLLIFSVYHRDADRYFS